MIKLVDADYIITSIEMIYREIKGKDESIDNYHNKIIEMIERAHDFAQAILEENALHDEVDNLLDEIFKMVKHKENETAKFKDAKQKLEWLIKTNYLYDTEIDAVKVGIDAIERMLDYD